MEAYVTLVATDSYASGALVLAHRLRDLGSEKEIVCLVTPNISSQVQDVLSKICTVIKVDTLYSKDHENLKLLGRPELDITFTKIQLWKLTQYSKIVFLDADTYPILNIDQLFKRPSFSAAPDAGWPDCFNSGVFVTEPSDATYEGLCQLAIDKGSFDGGDQGLLNSYFDSWATSPANRLPFTFNTTPTSQYGYAPAQNEYGQNIAVVHFIGENKPWKYQRFADGKVLPLGNAWEGTQHMIQAWWDTWDTYYGQTSPYHLLSGELDSKFDDGFQTRPIVPFDESVRNAWDSQAIDFDDYRRQIHPMPPISSITIGQPDWLIQEAERRRKEEEEEKGRRQAEKDQARQRQEEQRRQEEEDRRREEEERSREEQEKRDRERREREDDQEHHHNNHDNHDDHDDHGNHGNQHHDNHNHEQHHDNHNHEHYYNHNQEHHHHEEHHHNEEHNHHHHEEHNHHHHEEHHHHHEHKEPKEYSMIEWDPAYQEPPNTGKLGADIPDLSSFRNVWDQPRNEQANRWVAPVHQPEPQIMTKPEYSHYNSEEYAPDAYYAPIHHEFNPPPEPEPEPEPEPVVHHEHHHHHEEHHHHHHQEPEHPHPFPWDSNPDHFPPPTRVWLDEQPQHQQQPEQHYQEPESNHHHDDQNEQHQEHHHHQHHEEQHYQHHHYHEEYHEPPPPPAEEHNLSIVIDHHDDQPVETPIQTQAETPKEEEIVVAEQEPQQVAQPQQDEEDDQEEEPVEEQPTFAIDAMMSPAAQSKIDEFIASLIEDEDEEVSDRDLIPINFKPTSRLTGMYTPSPSGSRTGSRSNSRSSSRRASVSNSRRTSVSAISKPSPAPVVPAVVAASAATAPAATASIVTAPTFTIPTGDDAATKQSEKLFAASSSTFSRKTPYTSAAVTPAIGLTPDEFAGDGYFDDPEQDEFTFKDDFLNDAQYSFNDSFTEATTSDEWDPLGALNKLKEHSESMVLRQSLQEALVKTAKEQEAFEKQEEQQEQEQEEQAEITHVTTESIPINKTPKKKSAFKSTWDDEEYELPSALVSGESSPRTPIARSMSSSDLSKEIELEKERYKQQRASLMLAQPQAAVASVLEAELDLSRGTLFKRRYYDEIENQFDLTKSSEYITQETSELVESESDEEDYATDFVAYYDDYVIQEAQKRLRALVTGEDVETVTEMPLPIGEPKTNNNANKRPAHMYQYGEAKDPQPFSLLWNNNSYASNFGFDEKNKLPIYQSDLIPTDDVADEIKSLSTEIIVKEDPYTKKQRLAREEEERRLQEEKRKLEEETKKLEEEAKMLIEEARKLKEECELEEELSTIEDDDDANLTLDKSTLDVEISKKQDVDIATPTKPSAKETTQTESTLSNNSTESVEQVLTGAADKKVTTLEIRQVDTDNIPTKTSIPTQKVIEEKPSIIHQTSSSTLKTRQTFTSHASTFTTTTTRKSVTSPSIKTEKK